MTFRNIAAIGVAALLGGLGVASALVLTGEATTQTDCASSRSEALLANRIVGASQSYRKDNPAEYTAVRAYLEGGARPSGSLTHMGLHLVALEDTCRASDVTTTSTTTTTTTTTTQPTTTTTTTTTTPPPPSGSANLWIDTNGGTCTRQASPGSYSDAAACGTFDQAWDAASAGDTIRVRQGIYPGQLITGNKTSVTKIIGDPGVVITGQTTGTCLAWGPGTGLIQAQANFMWLENVRIDSGGVFGYMGGCIDASNVTYRNVDLYGSGVALYVPGDNFTWQGGQHGAPGVVPAPYRCTDSIGEPVSIDGNGATIDGVTFNVKKIAVGPGPFCGSDNTPHIENIRVEGNDNITIRNVLFRAGSDAGSGHVFITNFQAGKTISGIKIENTIFEPVDGTYAIQIHSNVSTYSGWTFRNNRFDQPILDPGNYVNLTACGNTGQVPSAWQTAC